MELAGEAEKLAKRLHPRDEEAAERHAIDAFLGALERPLAAEVQKLANREDPGGTDGFQDGTFDLRYAGSD